MIEMVDDYTDKRLLRIEAKIDSFNGILISNAKTDERMASYMSAASRLGGEVDQLWGEIDKMRDRIHAEEQRSQANQVTISYGERLFWLIIASAPWATYFVAGQ